MSVRRQVAREAARLMYSRLYNEYKDAKETAASNLGLSVIPSNFEVAVELDLLTEEMEPERQTRLMEMRNIALELMSVLREYEPRLIGSVWRGTIREGSDIDIVLYSSQMNQIRNMLQAKFKLTSVENSPFFVEGIPKTSTHIKLLQDGHEVEVVVRPPEDYSEERCEVYGDIKRGIGVNELEKLMRTDPLRRFIPKRRFR